VGSLAVWAGGFRKVFFQHFSSLIDEFHLGVGEIPKILCTTDTKGHNENSRGIVGHVARVVNCATLV
jgi:hypothetical protein